jgi:hypothetical protein
VERKLFSYILLRCHLASAYCHSDTIIRNYINLTVFRKGPSGRAARGPPAECCKSTLRSTPFSAVVAKAPVDLEIAIESGATSPEPIRRTLTINRLSASAESLVAYSPAQSMSASRRMRERERSAPCDLVRLPEAMHAR